MAVPVLKDGLPFMEELLKGIDSSEAKTEVSKKKLVKRIRIDNLAKPFIKKPPLLNLFIEYYKFLYSL
jgi:hypothetical protein